MKKLIYFPLLLALTACSTLPVEQVSYSFRVNTNKSKEQILHMYDCFEKAKNDRFDMLFCDFWD